MLRPSDVPVLKAKTNFEAIDLLPTGSRGVEIGVRKGRLSDYIVRKLDPSRFLMIDPWKHFPTDRQPDPSNESQANMDRMYEAVNARFGKLPNVEVRRATSLDATKWVGINELDWVFIDGDHTPFGCFLDLAIWYQKVRPGGYILVHDYVERDHFGIVQAIDEFLWRFTDVEVVGRTDELQYPTLVLRKSDIPQVDVEIKSTPVHAESRKLTPNELALVDKLKAASDEIYRKTARIGKPDPLVAETGLTSLAEARGRKKNVLHFCQVCWLGSVPLFIADLARVFPEFHHIMCYLNEWRTDQNAMDVIRSRGVEVVHWPKVTRDILCEVDPVAVVFHNTGGKSIEGEWPYEWLKEWPTMTYHHMVSWPLIPVDLDVFVSKEVFNRGYARCIKRAKKHIFVPPCIDTEPYLKVEHADNTGLTIGRMHTDHEDRHPPVILDIFRDIEKRVLAPRFIDVGGAKYYVEDGKTWDDVPVKWTQPPCIDWKSFGGLTNVWMPPTGKLEPWEFMALMDVFIMWNKPGITDTWSRVVTEAMAAGVVVISENKGGPTEQIEDGVNGFLVDPSEPSRITNIVARLAQDKDARLRIAQRARETATEYGYEKLRNELRGFFFNAMIGVR